MFRLLAVDIDGTLVNSQGHVPQAHREALHRAHAAGIRVCLCTGRSLTESRRAIEQLGLDLDAGVFVFGALVCDLRNGRSLFHAPLAEALAAQMIAFFQERDYPILALYDVSLAGTDYRFLAGARNGEDYARWMKVSPCQITHTDVLPLTPHLLRLGVIEKQAAGLSLYEEVSTRFPPEQAKCLHIYAPNYNVHVVECFAPQVNKWYGLQQLMTAWGISAGEVAAVGDDVNDLEMIRHAGLGIAMGNATPPVLRVAKMHVPSNDNAGIANAVEAILAGRAGT